MYRILAIGNSFSQDATHFLHQTALAAGIPTKVVNLYVGGCSLEQHWSNLESGDRAYQYQLNGACTDRYVCIEEVLQEDAWDFIVTQQASHDSGWLDSYEPFLGWIVSHLKVHTPATELFLQETWAYEINSTHDRFARYERRQDIMYHRLRSCYTRKALQYQIPLIPCGDVIQELRKIPLFDVARGGMSLCRDGFHMSYGYGRYALACTWLATLFGAEARNALKTYRAAQWDTAELAQLDSRVIAEICKTVCAVCSRKN